MIDFKNFLFEFGFRCFPDAAGELNSCNFRQLLKRFGEIDMLIFHDEGKNIPAFAAPETVPALPLGRHNKRRRFLVMERAQPLEITAGFFEHHPFADNIDNIYPGFDFINVTHRHAQNTINSRALHNNLLAYNNNENSYDSTA